MADLPQSVEFPLVPLVCFLVSAVDDFYRQSFRSAQRGRLVDGAAGAFSQQSANGIFLIKGAFAKGELRVEEDAKVVVFQVGGEGVGFLGLEEASAERVLD